jgi:ADP-ribosyl-[dinitrogen reductase] hydrolase
VGEITAYTLFERGVLRVGWHPRLDRAPSPLPPDICLADKIEGMLLGLAIGDALGNTSESMGIDLRRRRYGWIDHYLPNHCAEGRRVGLPSDDSQLAFRAVMQLVEHGKLVPQDLGCLIASGGIFGMGAATAAFVQRFNAGMPWERSGSPRASNGALMRIAPVLLPFVLEPSEALWHDTLRAAHLTHDDAVSNASCVALVHLLWNAIGMTRAPDAGWWIDEWLQVCDDLCLDARLRSRRPDRRSSRARCSNWSVRRSCLRSTREARRTRRATAGTPALTCSRPCRRCSTSSPATQMIRNRPSWRP